MKYLKDKYGEIIKCGNCNKNITSNDEIEYIREHCEYYCCPMCATNKYFDYEGSRPLDFKEAQENIQKDIYGWNV